MTYHQKSKPGDYDVILDHFDVMQEATQEGAVGGMQIKMKDVTYSMHQPAHSAESGICVRERDGYDRWAFGCQRTRGKGSHVDHHTYLDVMEVDGQIVDVLFAGKPRMLPAVWEMVVEVNAVHADGDVPPPAVVKRMKRRFLRDKTLQRGVFFETADYFFASISEIIRQMNAGKLRVKRKKVGYSSAEETLRKSIEGIDEVL